ncbi:YdcF family protein [Altererythrobacter sp. H2]|uniref:YdcF family protein n=1 Tax=Altererythrobacter sp. H2 TaxID=3108391 RepID=UPI002B4BABA4|nr:YdcF family protein [Altererythrobacter sp. H2]WRK96561.1 YdcF family protein [Altererythrobacter sp. H2]
MIRRLFAALLVLWAIGFLWFATTLPRPAGRTQTDAIIVPTGAAGRIERGLNVLERGDARTMLITGVDREVRPGEFAAEFDVPAPVMDCCVTLGFAAVDTRSNAAETAQWVRQNKVGSFRLVTTDWHMRRAAGELERTLPPQVVVVEDAVVSEPSLRILFVEYHKLLASTLARSLPG